MRSLVWWVVAAGALTVIVGLVVSSFVGAETRSSLEVFDRAQTDAESVVGNQVDDFEGVPASLRLLEAQDGWTAYAYRSIEDDVCLYVITGDLRTGVCATVPEFQDAGLGVVGDEPSFDILTQSWRTFVFRWGPTGDLRTTVEIIQ